MAKNSKGAKPAPKKAAPKKAVKKAAPKKAAPKKAAKKAAPKKALKKAVKKAAPKKAVKKAMKKAAPKKAAKKVAPKKAAPKKAVKKAAKKVAPKKAAPKKAVKKPTPKKPALPMVEPEDQVPAVIVPPRLAEPLPYEPEAHRADEEGDDADEGGFRSYGDPGHEPVGFVPGQDDEDEGESGLEIPDETPTLDED
ncbi:MAG TPA: hypothetical protein VL547_18910 [Dinghuibacter sp.]|jgi:adenylate kinase|uniref:hypothetical protein n=1 Tax=Dinghuibacter sp. TaxID=2024697 RepID=UPI002B85ED18|nr:hypothetical protein [Dinghuibacter sp.]HTJ14120.1 hypothetical protein [Dinghuibacter sp.]